jgi:hypothetical protein
MCSFIDLACHAQNAAWEWWANVSWLNKLLIIAGLGSIIFGVVWSLGGFLRRIGGWPAVVGAFALILGLVLTLLPKKPKDRLASENGDGPDFDPPPAKPKPKRKTLQDLFREGLR